MTNPVLTAQVLGLGALGPGVADWPQLQAVLAGTQTWQAQATVLPPPGLLPAAERRRASRVVKAALEAGTQAVQQAGLVASSLPVVFASSGGDGHNCHSLCELLASGDRLISPTRFHNSVHNAASGYWSIATRAMAPAQVIAAFDASFALGLWEAMSQAQYGQTPVLLIACDSEYPEPLHGKRPIADVSAVALVLGPISHGAHGVHVSHGTAAQLRIDAAQAWSGEPATALPEALRALPEQLPPWRGLSLLHALSASGSGTVALHVDVGQSLSVQVQGVAP